MKRVPPCVLTIAGSDSGGGAGVQADGRTIHALGGFACMAITAITAQNTRGVRSWRAEPPAMITAQARAVLEDLPVRAIKTGLLSGAAAVRAVAKLIARYPDIPIVVDPVLGSTSGTRFLNATGLRAFREELLPRATLITPNWPEAEQLSGDKIHSPEDAARVALNLVERFECAVLLKGGHGPGTLCQDFLATNDGKLRGFVTARIATPNTHGTGCVLASAIATELAHGWSVPKAVANAHAFLQASLRRFRRVEWPGAGPAFPGLG